MWMLVATLCMAWGKDAACSKHVWPAYKVRADCAELRKPMAEFLAEQAEASNGKMIFLSVNCHYGDDA